MSNIKKIRQEIERQRSFIEGLFIEGDNSFYDGQDDAYNHLLAFIDSLPDEKPSEDLEEAAKKYAHCPFTDDDGNFHEDAIDETAYRDFIAGAEWMRKKDVEDMYMSDNRHFLKCYEQGKVDMRVAMMKEAVEGEIGYWNQSGLSIRLDQSLEKLGYGEDTKVKIIIVKK